MSPENVQEEAQYEQQCGRMFAELAVETQRGVVAFKFGGTSMLGAKRMLHAAGLVKSATRT